MKRIFSIMLAALILAMCGTMAVDAKVKKSTRKATASANKSPLKIIKSTQQFGAELDTYAHGCDYQVTHTVIVANKSGKAVPASAYYLSISPVGKDYYGYSKTNTRQIPGKAIPANGTVTHIWTDVHFDGTWTYEDKVTLKLKR